MPWVLSLHREIVDNDNGWFFHPFCLLISFCFHFFISLFLLFLRIFFFFVFICVQNRGKTLAHTFDYPSLIIRQMIIHVLLSILLTTQLCMIRVFLFFFYFLTPVKMSSSSSSSSSSLSTSSTSSSS